MMENDILNNLDLLKDYGAVSVCVRKGEEIFQEGTHPRYFHQVVCGRVVLTSVCPEEKDVIQGIFRDGETFGEAPLLLNMPYAATARAVEDSEILKLPRDIFLNIIDNHPCATLKLLYNFARLYYDKTRSVRILASNNPKLKLLALFQNLKSESDKAEDTGAKFMIPYTRQQLADITGLRVETVIRTISRLSREKLVELRQHKVYY